MKKLITLIAGLLFVALPVGLAGCDDSDKEIYNDGRLVTDVVIPTSMTVYRGMEVSVSGYGFAQGDAIALRAGEDLPAATTVASEKLLTFVIPDGAADQTVYKVVLNRAQDYQVLGSSKMTVQLAIDVDLGKTISGNWGGDAVIRGRGFMATDKLLLEQGGGKFEAPVKGADDSSLTFTIPQNAADGDCEFTLQRGAEEQALGSAKLNLSLGGVTVPDKEGATIKGIVHLAGQGIADVLVSDGDLITKTDANGFYWLNSEKRNELAFVILPAGYDVPTVKAMPQFWQPCTLDANTVEQLDFQLLRADNDSHTMLVATPLNCTDIDSFAAELLRMFRYMSGIGFKINDMNTMGLVLEPLDPQEEPEPLQVQLERLPCSMEARWEILRVLTEFETYLRELTELLRPVAEQLAAEMQALTERNRAQLAIWEKYFQTHSVDTFQQEMFRASYLFTQEMQPDEVWIALWNFNMVGFWTEWFESGGKTVRIAYLGANLSFEFAAAHQVRPDAETLCAMMRALTGKDKLEILRRCAAEPFSAAQLAASMNLNSGTVSRNVYGLYKLGYLETRGDGERVNYITRPDALERLFRWVLEYVSEQK